MRDAVQKGGFFPNVESAWYITLRNIISRRRMPLAGRRLRIDVTDPPPARLNWSLHRVTAVSQQCPDLGTPPIPRLPRIYDPRKTVRPMFPRRQLAALRSCMNVNVEVYCTYPAVIGQE